jgi:hypothetical protein
MDTWGHQRSRFLLIDVVLLGVATLLALAARRRALARERAREVARAWPGLAAELGPDFTERFLADGLAFADALAREGRLPDSARVERMAARAHLSTRAVRLAATMAGPRRRLVVTVRAPGLGERWLSLPLG